MLDLKKIKWYAAPDKEYYKEVFPKVQAVVHHTASGGNSMGDIDYLNKKDGKVHVALWIDRDGQIWQAFSTKYHAPHLGTPTSTFKKFKVNNTVEALHKCSVGIEMDSWGYLTKKGDKFYAYTGAEVKPENVITYPEGFLGQKYYEKYYEPQLKALKDILEYLCDTYDIAREYQCDMWAVSANALAGKSGIFTHISYREDGKWDCHPQKELINVLKSIGK